VVVAAEIKDSQTAKKAFERDAAVDSVCNADAAHTAGTTVVEAPKSLKVFSKEPNFEAIDKSGQDQGRVHFPLDFFRESLIAKKLFQKLRTLL